MPKRKNVVEQNDDSKISSQGILFTNQINTFGPNQNEDNMQQAVALNNPRKFSSRFFKDDFHMKRSIIDGNNPLVNKLTSNLKGGSMVDSSTGLNSLLQKVVGLKKSKVKDYTNILNIDLAVPENQIVSEAIIGEHQLNNIDLSENSDIEYKIQIPHFILVFGEVVSTIKKTPQDNYVDSNEYYESSLEDRYLRQR